MTYNGQAQELVNAGETDGGTMQYAIGTATEASEHYTTSIPAKTDAGTYYVWYRVVGDENHNSTKAQSVEVTIAKATPGITAPTAKTGLIYTGSAQELVNAGSTKDGTLYYAVTTENKAPTNEKLYATSVPAATDAGTYYVWYKVKGDDNHNDYGPYTVAVTILNAKVAPKAPTGESLVYNGKQQSLVKAGSVEGGTLVYAVGKDGKTAPAKADFKADIPTKKDAGTYYVWYKVEGDRNHNSTDPVALEAKIARKSLVVTAAGKAKTYGEADPELSWTQEGLVDGDPLVVTLKRAAGENVGDYAINADRLEASDNYETGFNAAVLEIESRSVTVTAADQTITEGETIETGVKQAGLSGQVKGHALSAVTLTAGDGAITASTMSATRGR